jgi:hypothetical protein
MSLKRGSTLFLRTVILLTGIAVLLLCVFVIPSGLKTTTNWLGYRPVLVGMILPVIPFFIGLYNAWNLLNYVDKNKAFSKGSFNALNSIKYSAAAISLIYFINLPFIIRAALFDDAPGVIMLGLMFTFGPLAVAVIAGLLQKLLKNAINIKSKNDLTV